MIYNKSVFEDLIYEVGKWKVHLIQALLTSCVPENSLMLVLSFHNIAIANVEKEGIRDSRSQISIRVIQVELESSSFIYELDLSPKVIREEWSAGFGPES